MRPRLRVVENGGKGGSVLSLKVVLVDLSEGFAWTVMVVAVSLRLLRL